MTDEPTTKVSDIFRRMADRIDHNVGSTFGGAVVVLPASGDPIEFMLIGEPVDVAQFYSTLNQRINNAVTALDEAAKSQLAFGQRR